MKFKLFYKQYVIVCFVSYTAAQRTIAIVYFSWGCCVFVHKSTLHYKQSFAKITPGSIQNYVLGNLTLLLKALSLFWQSLISLCEFLNLEGRCWLAGKLAPAALTRKSRLHMKDSSDLHIWPSLAQVKATQAPVVGNSLLSLTLCLPLFLLFLFF